MNKKIRKLISTNARIISLEHGLGEMKAIFPMYDGIDDYLEVQYLENDKSKFVNLSDISDLRLLSSRIELDKSLRTLNQKLNDSEIENETGNYRNTLLEKNTLLLIVKIIDLFRKDELSTKEHALLQLQIESLITEVKEVYEVDQNCARGIVSDYLKSA